MVKNDDFGHTYLNSQNIPQARHIESFYGTLGPEKLLTISCSQKIKFERFRRIPFSFHFKIGVITFL